MSTSQCNGMKSSKGTAESQDRHEGNEAIDGGNEAIKGGDVTTEGGHEVTEDSVEGGKDTSTDCGVDNVVYDLPLKNLVIKQLRM